MTLPLRKAIFWLHLSVGLIAGAIILILSVSGALLTYEEQILSWARREYRSSIPSVEAQRLPIGDLVSIAQRARPNELPRSVIFLSDPEEPAKITFGRRDAVYVNPYTGDVLGEGPQRTEALLHEIVEWHRWLGASGERRGPARAVTGACNLGFLFLILSGLYLWVPRRWTRSTLRAVTWFRSGLRPKARDFNWHNVFGLWLAIPLLAVVASGVVMSYPWANRLLYQLAGEEAPSRRGGSRNPDASEGEQPTVELQGIEALWVAAAAHEPGWRQLNFDLPTTLDQPRSATVYHGGRGRPDLRRTLTMDPIRQQVVQVESFADQSPGRRLRTWVRWIHTGEAGGLLGQTIAGLASAGAAILLWTGFALAWRRLMPTRRRNQKTSRSG